MKKIMFNDKMCLTQAVLEGRKTQTNKLKYPNKSHPNKSFRDLSGLKFGRLKVVELHHTDQFRKSYWKCECECGKIVIVRGSALTTGNTKSCGCLIYESKNIKHGMKHERLYRIWSGIKARCYTKNNKAYDRYGGRGISMCQEWKDNFVAFYKWAMDNGYLDDLSIDRINVNGNYEPSNCRWSTPKEQSDNKRCNILITISGITLDLQQWCDKIGINRSTVNTRVRICGWDYEKALTEPVRKHKNMQGERQRDMGA